MFLYAVVLLKVWGSWEKFSKFCHGELVSVEEKGNGSGCRGGDDVYIHDDYCAGRDSGLDYGNTLNLKCYEKVVSGLI